MLRPILHLLPAALALGMALSASGQPASPSPASTAAAPRAVIDSLNSADVQKAIDVLKSNYLKPDALNETELDRAKLEGVLARIGRGAILTAEGSQASQPPSAFYSDILSGHIAYLRPGDISRANVDAMDPVVQSFASKKIDAAIVDLRASSGSSDFEMAAEFAKRFCPKGKLLFTVRKAAARQERTFTADREPAFSGLVIVLADAETSGAAEMIAGALRLHNKALVIGAQTAGRPVEYADFKIAPGKTLRVAVGEAVLPEGNPIFPDGLKPDLAVELPAADKREIFVQSREKGMGPFVFEPERPHMNEAALMAGRNPEIEALEAAQRRGRPSDKGALRDPVAQRALDVVTSISVYQRK